MKRDGDKITRTPRCGKESLKKGSWTALEDQILVAYVQAHGEGKWRNLSTKAGLNRCGKSCRLRWLNYLRPGIKRGNISADEEALIVRLHRLLGNRWSLIARRLPGRTDNEIKNYWNTTLGKKAAGETSEGNGNQRKGATASAGPDKGAAIMRTKATRCTGTFFGLEKLLLRPPSPPPLPSNYLQQSSQRREEEAQRRSAGGGKEVAKDDSIFRGLSENSSEKHGFDQLDVEFDLSFMDSLVDSQCMMNVLDFD